MKKTPNELRRLSTSERDTLLDGSTGLLLTLDGDWLSAREKEHLEWGRGARCRKKQADFDRAAAKVARERKIRLALALVAICGAPVGAARRATWARVDLEARQWTVPRSHLPNVERKGMGAQERFKRYRITPQAESVFRAASMVGDGWELLPKIVGISLYELMGSHDVCQPRPPARSPLVFPAQAGGGTPLSDNAIRYRLKTLP